MTKSDELMFSIKVGIKYTSLEGLSALDERRRLKLPDHNQLHIPSSQLALTVKVDEAFARLHQANFLDSIDGGLVMVPLSMLVPGEILAEEVVRYKLVLSDERVQALWSWGVTSGKG